MILSEILSQPLNYSWDDRNKEGRFTIAGKEYIISFIREYPLPKNIWTVEFVMTQDRSNRVKSTIDITGTGDAYAVFSTIHAIIKDFIEMENPSYLIFYAMEPSRQKLYDRIVAKQTQDWNVSTSPGSNGTGKRYTLTRK